MMKRALVVVALALAVVSAAAQDGPPPATPDPAFSLGGLLGAVALIVVITLVQVVLTLRRGQGTHDAPDAEE